MVDIKTIRHQESATLSDNKRQQEIGLPDIGMRLDDIVQSGARCVIAQAIEAQWARRREQDGNVTTRDGQRAVVSHGYLSEREVLTGAAAVGLKVPKGRERSGSGASIDQAQGRPVQSQKALAQAGSAGQQ